MAAVFGIHEFGLSSEVNRNEFEKFINEEWIPHFAQLSGTHYTLLKGDRGSRSGLYLLIVKTESVTRRDGLWPAPGKSGDETQRVADCAPLFNGKPLSAYWEGYLFNDYVVLGE